MLTPATRSRLLQLIRRHRHDFLQFLLEAAPWAGPADQPLLTRLAEMARREGEAMRAILQSLEDVQVAPPPTGTYPMHFTAYHFVAIRSLLPVLIGDHAAGVAELEAGVPSLGAELPAPLAAGVRQLLDCKRGHHAEMLTLRDAR